jgi:hypothetical protein
MEGIRLALVTVRLLKKAEANGIKYRTLYDRLSKGWDEEKATTKPPTNKGERWKWMQIAEKNGIKRGTFENRVHLYGWSYEEAATKPLRGK